MIWLNVSLEVEVKESGKWWAEQRGNICWRKKTELCCTLEPNHHYHHLQTSCHDTDPYLEADIYPFIRSSLRQDGKLPKFQWKPVSIHKDGDCCFLIECRDISIWSCSIFIWLLRVLCGVCNWCINTTLYRNGVCKVCSVTSMACKTEPLIISITFISIHFRTYSHFLI